MAQIFNLDNFSVANACYAIEQGETLNNLAFYYQEVDVSDHVPTGEIRDNYFDPGGTVLATFSFDPLTFASVTVGTDTFNATIIKPTLTDAQTQAIPLTPLPLTSSQGIVGLTVWVYDIKLTSPGGDVIILARGHVQVVPDVTRI